MNAILTFALTKIVKDKAEKAARKQLTVGTHAVDSILHVKGVLEVGEDSERAPTTNISLKKTLALLVKHGAFKQEVMKEFLAEQIKILLAEGDLPGVGEAEMAVIDEVIATLPKAKVKGSVTSNLLVSELVTVEGKMQEVPALAGGKPLSVTA